jgi:ATP-dependent protease ClpP protease subunit
MLMKYYLHADSITDESVSGILEFINNNDGPITIGINSVGGGSSVMAFLVDTFNANSDRITLIAVCGVYSAAFELFFRFTGKRKMTSGCQGMYHYSSIEINHSASGLTPTGQERGEFEKLENDKILQDDFCSNFMTEQELAILNEGKDVWFGFKRMKEIFTMVEII